MKPLRFFTVLFTLNLLVNIDACKKGILQLGFERSSISEQRQGSDPCSFHGNGPPINECFINKL